ncbi:hypothetical protein V2G26_006836 [Clonostachys chloroleuca]
MPRLVRRKPFMERMKAMLNPMDFLLWLSEEMETRDWDSQVVGTQIGLALNFVFLLARANSGPSSSSGDDIFGDDSGGSWLRFVVHPLVWGLIIFSCTHTFYALNRTRKYRLFQADVDIKPSTPSVRRVKLQSDMGTSSPLRYLIDMVAPESAESRAHPDKAKDVWELAVWDPLPISVRLLCFFSPGHVLVYILFLPLAPLDPRPSVTVFNALLVQAVLSVQLLFLVSRFTQQGRDNSIIQKEVMNEYNTKFVHPRIHPTVREVGVQVSSDKTNHIRDVVQVGTPTTLVQNSYFSRQSSRSSPELPDSIRNKLRTPRMSTPPSTLRHSDVHTPVSEARTPLARKSLPAEYTSTATSTSASTPGIPASSSTGFGGNMGIHIHNKSPLKKAISMGDMNTSDMPSPRNSREMASFEQRNQALHRSPSKGSDFQGSTRPNPFAVGAPGFKNRPKYDRYPSIR